jgi:hypothetical protein
MASMTEELKFKFYLTQMNLNLESHTGLVAAILNSVDVFFPVCTKCTKTATEALWGVVKDWNLNVHQ